MANWKEMIGTKVGFWDILERDYNPTSKQHSTFFKCRCGLCGEVYSVSRDSLVNGKSSCCNRCKKPEGTEHINIGTRFGMLTTLDRAHKKEDRYAGHRFITCKCDCGNVVEVDVRHLKGRYKNGVWEETRSCGCKSISNGELRIKQVLDEMGLVYKMQYRDPAFNVLAPFDFAIFDGDLMKCLIEYDGEQHYRPVDHFGGEETFEQQKIRDAAKNEYCAQARIKLIRIGYMEFKNINSQYLINLMEE